MLKKWGWLLAIGIVLAAAAATLWWWWPPLLAFLKIQDSVLQRFANVFQIILGIGAVVSWIFSFLRRGKMQASTTEEKPSDGRKPETPTPLATDPTTLRRTYLERVFTTCRSLSLTGIDPKAASSEAKARLELDAVYTAMLTKQSETPEQGHSGKIRVTVPEKGARPLSAVEQLNRHKHLMLLGDPGAGKSTFVDFVTLCLAGEALGKEKIGLDLLTAPLPTDDETKEENQRPQSWVHGPLLPVRIVLRDFAARGLPTAGEFASADHLWRFLETELQNAGLGDFSPHLRKELLERGGLLLLDGLDEVPEAEERREQLKQVVEDFVTTFARCRVLVTSRTYAYQDKAWRLAGFAETTLAPFSKGQIRRFIRSWYDHVAILRGLQHDDARGSAALLERAVFDSDRLLELAERPLLLTLMASLHAWRGGTLPEKRVELYADAADLLLDWWEQPKVVRDAKGNVEVQQPSLAQWLQVDREQVRQLLNELAYEAHAAQPQTQLASTADLAEGDLLSGLMRLRRNPDVNPARLVEYLSERAGLLLPRGAGVYTFPHRTFQEYLAACHLTDDDFPDKLAKLGCSDPDRWREVVLLAAGKSAGGSDFAVWALAESLCPLFLDQRDKDVSSNESLECWGALLAGQVLAESARLGNLSSGNRTKLERVQAWLIHLLGCSDFPAIERTAAGNALARLGDPRFREDAYFLPDEHLLGFVEIPEGAFTMGEGNEQHELTLPQFYMARYPVTVAQFRAFADETGHKPESPNSLRGIASHPVRYVTWHEALKYCTWLTDKLRQWDETPAPIARLVREHNWRVILPSEAEWEKAARGKDGGVYPWGDEPDPNKANYSDTGIATTTPVGCFPDGASPYGCQDIVGNVWEWTRSLWGREPMEPDFRYPYDRDDSTDDRENLEVSDDILRVLRGGAFLNFHRDVRCASRYGYLPLSRYDYFGFRVALSPFL